PGPDPGPWRGHHRGGTRRRARPPSGRALRLTPSVERLVHQGLLLDRVDLAQARGGRGHRSTRDPLDRRELRDDLRQVEGEEAPRTLVGRLLLDPPDLGEVRVVPEGFTQATERDRVDLFQSDDRDVVAALLLLAGGELVVELPGDQQHGLDLARVLRTISERRVVDDGTELPGGEVRDRADGLLVP